MISKLLRIPRVASVLDTTPERVYELIRLGLLPAVRMGRQLRVEEEALRDWIKGGGQAISVKARVKDRTAPAGEPDSRTDATK